MRIVNVCVCVNTLCDGSHEHLNVTVGLCSYVSVKVFINLCDPNDRSKVELEIYNNVVYLNKQ